MAYPIANATKTHLDATTDDPSQARAELATLVDKFNELLGLLSQTPAANQVPVLASDGELTPIAGLSLEHMSTYHRQIRNHSGGAGQLMLSASSGPSLNANCYFDGTNWRYISTGPAMHILCDGSLGQMRLYAAASGGAGTIVTFGAERAIWHAGNDGAGSGLDADLLDGQQGSYYQPAGTAIANATNAAKLNGATLGYTTITCGTAGVEVSHNVGYTVLFAVGANTSSTTAVRVRWSGTNVYASSGDGGHVVSVMYWY